MPIVRKRLAPSQVYPDGIRYNPSGDQVEVLIDGVWTPSPESDPRKKTDLPPRITADTKCDAAQSVADALENQIAQIILAIDNTLTLFQIAGLILGLFSFGVFAIFINIALAIADYMFGLGSGAIQAALPPSAYETVRCILYCHMDANGRLPEGQLASVQQAMVDELGATGGTIINQMIGLAGVGGINGLASVGTSTGDCSTCGCGCGPGCATTTVQYNYTDVAWITHGGYWRSLATTPVGQFDSFTLAGTTALLDIGATKCVRVVTMSVNNGCPFPTGAGIELFINGLTQGIKQPIDRVNCVNPSVTWNFPDGISTDAATFVQVGTPCQPGREDRVFCAKITSCV